MSVGDDVMIQENDKLTAAKVINVSCLIMQGQYSSSKFSLENIVQKLF